MHCSTRRVLLVLLSASCFSNLLFANPIAAEFVPPDTPVSISFMEIMAFNFLFAVIEGALIGFVLKLNPIRASLIMLVANTLSLAIGMLLNCNSLMTYFLTSVCFEWPFCYYLLRRAENSFLSSLLACASAHVMTYGMAFILLLIF